MVVENSRIIERSGRLGHFHALAEVDGSQSRAQVEEDVGGLRDHEIVVHEDGRGKRLGVGVYARRGRKGDAESRSWISAVSSRRTEAQSSPEPSKVPSWYRLRQLCPTSFARSAYSVPVASKKSLTNCGSKL